MSPEFIEKWERLLEDVDKQKIPVEFIKKIVLKLRGRRQQTINIGKLTEQGLYPEEIEDEIKNLKSLDDAFELVEENLGGDDGGYFTNFTTKIIEMKPIKLENSIQVEDLLDLPAVIKMGKRVFSDFDSKMQSS